MNDELIKLLIASVETFDDPIEEETDDFEEMYNAAFQKERSTHGINVHLKCLNSKYLEEHELDQLVLKE